MLQFAICNHVTRTSITALAKTMVIFINIHKYQVKKETLLKKLFFIFRHFEYDDLQTQQHPQIFNE